MVFRIIRGALVGIVLGLLMGVGLSGAMYMFNYMKAGADWDSSQSLMAEDSEAALTIETEGDNFVPALSSVVQCKNYDSLKVKNTLNQQGINGLARELASNNWSLEQGRESEEEEVLGESLIRFHVRANSNSDVDIALKYKVRDAVLASIEEDLSQCATREEAEEYLTESLELIKETAEKTLADEGFKYTVEAYLTNDYFPIRQYGDMVLPAGYYEALRVDIGLAEGENFWCLLYPTMCVPIEAGGVITRDGQQELEKELSEEQFDRLFVKKEVPKENIEIRFKLWELLFGNE